MTPLKTHWMELYKPITDNLKLDMRMNLKTKKVRCVCEEARCGCGFARLGTVSTVELVRQMCGWISVLLWFPHEAHVL